MVDSWQCSESKFSGRSDGSWWAVGRVEGRGGHGGGNKFGSALHTVVSGLCKEQAGVIGAYGVVRCSVSEG